MFYADATGLSDVYAQIVRLHSLHEHYWEPAPLLRRLAEQNSSFAAWDAVKAKRD
jgi:3-hydroxyacyl-CoA dehydrogenase